MSRKSSTLFYLGDTFVEGFRDVYYIVTIPVSMPRVYSIASVLPLLTFPTKVASMSGMNIFFPLS
jgi:hypothetical protein